MLAVLDNIAARRKFKYELNDVAATATTKAHMHLQCNRCVDVILEKARAPNRQYIPMPHAFRLFFKDLADGCVSASMEQYVGEHCCDARDAPMPLPDPTTVAAAASDEFPMKPRDEYVYECAKLDTLISTYGQARGFTYEATTNGGSHITSIRCMQCVARHKFVDDVERVIAIGKKRNLQLDDKPISNAIAATRQVGHCVEFHYRKSDDGDSSHDAVYVNSIEPMHCCQLDVQMKDDTDREQGFLHDVVSELCDRSATYHRDFRKRRRIDQDDLKRITQLDHLLSKLK